MLAAHPALRAEIPANHIELVMRVAIEAANSLQHWALSADDPESTNQIICEMKVLLKGYVGVYTNLPTPFPKQNTINSMPYKNVSMVNHSHLSM
jgi:hypothetical protein